MRGRVAATAALLVALAAGCDGDPVGDAAPTPSPTSAPTSAPASGSASSPASPPSPSVSATTFVGGPLGRCSIPRTAARVEAAELTGRGLRLPAGVFAPAGGAGGRTVLVLLHQSDGGGLCGWGPFGNAVAASGMTALAFDQCGYGTSDCSVADPDDPLPQVLLAVAFARERLGARRVVLVGASMGGARAVRAVAEGAPVDAWADVSGPSTYDGVALAPLAGEVAARGLPGLVALAGGTDGEEEADAARALAETSGATWLPAAEGHGYTLLTDDDGLVLPTGRAVLSLAATAAADPAGTTPSASSSTAGRRRSWSGSSPAPR